VIPIVDKLLPGNETVLLVPAVEVNGVPHLIGDTLVPIEAPTSAVLNEWIVVTVPSHANAGAGGNVSCAIRDDMNLGLTDSDTDSDRTICSVGQSEDPTFYNFDAELTGFVDADVDGDGVYNLFRDLTRAPDIPYVISHRIGYGQTVAAASGQEWDFYYAWTDNPVIGYGDGNNQTTTQNFVPKNIVNVGYELTA
jgi:hypothetical protein